MRKHVTRSLYMLLIFLGLALNSFGQGKTFTAGQEVAFKSGFDNKWYVSKYLSKQGTTHKVSYTMPGGGVATEDAFDGELFTMEEAKKQNAVFANASSGTGPAGSAPAAGTANTGTAPANTGASTNKPNTSTAKAPPGSTGNAGTAPSGAGQQEKETLRNLINDYRKTKDGSGALAFDNALNRAAQDYANVLEQTGKTGHTVSMSAPNGTNVTDFQDRVAIAALALAGNNPATPFAFSYVNADAFKSNVKIANLKLGEILTYGWGTPAEALQAFKSSPPHDGNMRTADWTHVGIGISRRKLADGSFSGYNWVVMFGTPNGDASARLTLDGTYSGASFDGKQYYTRFVRKN